MPDREQTRRLPASRFLAPAIFALLILATVAAFAVAQRQKRKPLVLDKVTFAPLVHGQTVITPNGDGHADLARVRFRLTRSDHGVVQLINRDDRPVRTFTVKIISPKGRVTARIPPGGLLQSFKTLGFRWNGLLAGGRPAPTGPYRLRVKLPGQGRDMVFPLRIKIEARRFKPGDKNPT